jgi:E3 ubiquitin-protein ligase RNF5
VCPVCKGAVSRDNVIPIYGRGMDKMDPRIMHIPERPSAQRAEPSPDPVSFLFRGLVLNAH